MSTFWRTSYNRVDRSYGEMFVTGGGSHTIDTANKWHAFIGLASDEIAGDITFAAGTTGSDITVMATSDDDARTKITTTGAHNLALNDIITIFDTTNYNDVYQVMEIVNVTNFTIDKTWDTNDDATGTFARGDRLRIGTQSEGKYLVNWACSATVAAGTPVFHFGVYDSKTLEHKISRKFANATDIGAIAGSGVLDLSANDDVWFALLNVSATNNIDVDEMSFVIHKI